MTHKSENPILKCRVYRALTMLY